MEIIAELYLHSIDKTTGPSPVSNKKEARFSCCVLVFRVISLNPLLK
jgi:hypothetical protein